MPYKSCATHTLSQKLYDFDLILIFYRAFFFLYCFCLVFLGVFLGFFWGGEVCY